MRVCLVTMPWHAVDCPSVAVGILHRLIEVDHEVVDVYGSLRWAAYALRVSDGRLTPADYTGIAETGIYDGLGDWVFVPALEEPPASNAEYESRVRDALPAPIVDAAVFLRRHAAGFVQELAAGIAALEPDLVGFTTTFMQNVPSLAVAKALRALHPRTKIAFGGGNCDGPMGAALHRNYPFIDFVVRGEGERTFPALLRTLSTSQDFATIPGLCWRAGDCDPSRQNDMSTEPVEMEEVPNPSFDGYFRELEATALEEYLEPKLVVEMARGCWWGEKHHCTFCGLNGSLMRFRSKSASAAWEDMAELVKRHRILDVIAVDNIMDMGYFREFLPLLAASDWDLRVHYEVKSNLTPAQVQVLSDARVTHIQPGIESLSSSVLRLMRKGVTGCQNVRLLRECEQRNLTVSWNYLYGFPGESPEDYRSVVDQFAHLAHLQPPSGASRIVLQRFSPNFNDPSIGFSQPVPSHYYRYLYVVPDGELFELAYSFECEDRGLCGAPVVDMNNAIQLWRDRYRNATLEYVVQDEALFFTDGRQPGGPREIVYDSTLAVRLYEALAAPRSLASLFRDMAELGASSATELGELMDRFSADGLIFREGDQAIALGLKPTPVRMKNPT